VPRGVALNLLASALTILATIAFLASAAEFGGVPVVAPAAAGSVVVYRFYEAVNEVIKTGNPAVLESVLAPDFVSRASSRDDQLDGLRLASRLVSIHAVAPSLQLTVVDVTTAGDRAVALLKQSGFEPGAFLGVPLGPLPELWGDVDAFRVENGRIGEFWPGNNALVPRLDPLGTALLGPQPESDQVISFRRLNAAVGRDWTQAMLSEPRVIYVDGGALTITADPASQAPAVVFGRNGQKQLVQPGDVVTVLAGQTLAVAADTRYALGHAPSQRQLRAFEVDFPRYEYTGPLQPNLAPGEDASRTAPQLEFMRETLAESTYTGLLGDAVAVSLGRITLPPGASLALTGAEGPILLTVEVGKLELASDLANAVPADSERWRGDSPVTVLARDQAAVIPAGTATYLRARDNEPAVAFLATVLPCPAEAKSCSSSP
jgi:SnoaL-like polyketide cyclase